MTAVSLADAGTAVLDCEHKTPAAQKVGFPYIAIPDTQDGRVLLDQARRISELDLVAWTRRTTPIPGDILVTRRGRVGDTAPIPAGVRCAIGQNLVLLRVDRQRVDPAYLRWAVRGPEWWSEVDRLLNVGAVFTSLNVRDIARIRLSFPPLPEQQTIAEVLSALDDKIAANTALISAVDCIGAASYNASLDKASTVNLGAAAQFLNRRRVPLAAGIPRLSLDDLGPDFIAKAQEARNPQLAIEALRAALLDESTIVAHGNLVRQRAFSERIAEIMNRYTNQQLTSAEVIAALVDLAKDVAHEASRGGHFSPPLSGDELAFFDAVAQNESAVDVQGEDVLAQIARELVAIMRRDVRTDWTVRDDVRAKLRSSIKRLLVKYKYPPDRQPAAIKLVMDQMESMAPRYADERRHH